MAVLESILVEEVIYHKIKKKLLKHLHFYRHLKQMADSLW